MPPPRYPSDLSDEEWAILKPLLSRAERRGRPSRWSTRQVADAVFYLLRSGCPWRMCCPGRVPALADRLLPLPQVANRPTAQESARPPA